MATSKRSGGGASRRPAGAGGAGAGRRPARASVTRGPGAAPHSGAATVEALAADRRLSHLHRLRADLLSTLWEGRRRLDRHALQMTVMAGALLALALSDVDGDGLHLLVVVPLVTVIYAHLLAADARMQGEAARRLQNEVDPELEALCPPLGVAAVPASSPRSAVTATATTGGAVFLQVAAGLVTLLALATSWAEEVLFWPYLLAVTVATWMTFGYVVLAGGATFGELSRRHHEDRVMLGLAAAFHLLVWPVTLVLEGEAHSSSGSQARRAANPDFVPPIRTS